MAKKNIQPYFNTEERLTKLAAEAASWLDTPFMMNGAAKGGGVSCQMLPIAIYKECGFTLTQKIPKGTGGMNDASKQFRMSKWIARTRRFQRIKNKVPQAGDMLTFRVENGEYHLGLFLRERGKEFIHTIKPYGVSYSNLYDASYGDRLLSVWRPIEIIPEKIA